LNENRRTAPVSPMPTVSVSRAVVTWLRHPSEVPIRLRRTHDHAFLTYADLLYLVDDKLFSRTEGASWKWARNSNRQRSGNPQKITHSFEICGSPQRCFVYLRNSQRGIAPFRSRWRGEELMRSEWRKLLGMHRQHAVSNRPDARVGLEKC